MRIAFLTPEFVTEDAQVGGLGNYLNRMTLVLAQQGHEIEIFVTSERSESVRHGRVLVHRVKFWPTRFGSRLLRVRTLGWLPKAKAIADAVRKRECETHFDLIQSADYLAVGILVKPRKGRLHLVRCSSAWDLYSECDGIKSLSSRAQSWLERRAIRRADGAYAPSRFIADYFQGTHQMKVGVVRPPAVREIDREAVKLSVDLPPRFFVHFGQLMRRKGTEHLARALPRVWEQCPDFAMVWVGRHGQQLERLTRTLWREAEDRVVISAPMPKPELYEVLRRAEVAVLPSLVDNLPNTAIESLMAGIPVIAFDGASLDELVENGRTGELVPMADVEALASALVRWWRGPAPVKKGFVWDSELARQMQPEIAVRELLRFAEQSLQAVRQC